MKKIVVGLSSALTIAALAVGASATTASAEALSTATASNAATAAASATTLSSTATGVLLASAPQSSFVTALYQDFLNRDPGASEVSYWASQLNRGAPRGSIADSFVNSDEYRLDRIDSAYRTILGREPEASGRASWLDGMHKGLLATDDVEKSFYASQEFYLRSGGNDFSWVDGLYRQILGREATPQEELSWVSAGNRGTPRPGPGGWIIVDYAFDRTWVVNQIFGSTEAARSRVTYLYEHYLGREPEEGGLAGWAQFDLQAGDAALRAGITSSDEYFARAQSRFPL